MGKFIDMTGWVLKEHGVEDSRATVIKFAGKDKNGLVKWECLCECGKEFVAYGADLRKGKMKSCGCLSRLKASVRMKERNRKQNEFSEILSDEYGDYIIGRTTNNQNEFYFDASDYDVVKQFCWCDYVMNSGYHALLAFVSEEQRSHFGINKTTIYLHQLIGCSYYDHIDRNPLNNRRYNLRQCTQAENTRNRSIRKDNKSGVAGVYWHNGRWTACIKSDGQYYHLGQFKDKTQAIIARLEKERELFGEFAPQKELYKEYLK